MNIVKDVFGSGFELYNFLNQKAKVRNITKRKLIREIRNNIKRLEHRNKKGVSKFLLIQKLENVSILDAIDEGFDFNKLAPKQKIDDKTIEYISSAKRFKNWNAEKIVGSIDEKIVSLKELEGLYEDESLASINITARLNNLYLLLIFLSILIKNSE